MTAGLPLVKHVVTTLAEGVKLTFKLTAGISATNAAIQKKILESGTIALIISNEEMEDIMKIVESLEEPGLLIQGINETTKNEAKEKKADFFQCC